MSPGGQTDTDQKKYVDAEIFYQETQDLVNSANDKLAIKANEQNVMSLESQIKKLRFDLEREEKQAIKD